MIFTRSDPKGRRRLGKIENLDDEDEDEDVWHGGALDLCRLVVALSYIDARCERARRRSDVQHDWDIWRRGSRL